VKILLVEDEVKLGKKLVKYLSDQHYFMLLSRTVADAREKFLEKPDLVILDCRLPDGEGFDLLREWKGRTPSIPVIMLTARVEIVDKVLGLELGANDYITKPFEPRELLARINVQRRILERLGSKGKSDQQETPLSFAGIELDLESRCVTYQSRLIALTRLEFDLLHLFVDRPRRVFSRKEILASVWGSDNLEPTRTVDYHVSMLRQKLGSHFFESVRGIGYRLSSEIAGRQNYE